MFHTIAQPSLFGLTTVMCRLLLGGDSLVRRRDLDRLVLGGEARVEALRDSDLRDSYLS